MSHALRFAPFALLSAVAAAAQPANPPAPDHGNHIIKPLVEGGVLKGSDVLSGDPDKPGSAYVGRIHNYDRFIAMPHWHPEDEHIVVIKGRWFLGHGDTFDRSRLRELNVGDYAFVPKRMTHFGWADGEVVIQVHGIGPFKTNFVNEWKQLSDPKAAALFKFKEKQRVLSPRGAVVVLLGYGSARDRITQYLVEKPDGEKFFALETELQETR